MSCLLALGLVAQTVATPIPDSVAVSIGRHVALLAADSMRGRATPSRGLELGAAYAARQLRLAGLSPAGDSGTFFQRYTILRTRVVADSSSVTVLGGATRRWRLGRDVFLLPVGEVPRRDIRGPAVLLVGVPSDSLRPFGDLDVRGAVVIQLAGFSDAGLDAPRWLLQAGARAGVAAWILVDDRPPDAWRARVESVKEPRTLVRGVHRVLPFPVLEMQDATLGAYLSDLGVPAAGIRPLPQPPPLAALLTGIEVRLRLVERILSRRTAPNVVALLPGGGGGSAVMLTAHLDGLGVDRPVGADSIYNGADDDAAGVAAVLEAARALARDANGSPLRRHVYVALFSGTERGLWGSDYFAEHPPVPLAEIAAAVNVEAIGRNLPDSVVVIGKDQPRLRPVVDAVAAGHHDLGLTVLGDPWPAEHLLWTSDHSVLIRRGVPVLYLYNGKHGDLHQPGDEAGKINGESVARVARFLALLARELANHEWKE